MDTNTGSGPFASSVAQRRRASTAGDLLARALLAVGEGCLAYGVLLGHSAAWLEARSELQAERDSRRDAARGMAQIEAFLSHRDDQHPAS